MIRKLQIIFGHHAIAGQLRVTRQRLIFLVKLRRIAARAVIDPVATVVAIGATAIWAGRAAATPAATVLTIIDQRANILVTGGIVSHHVRAGIVPAARLRNFTCARPA